ncbi:MAG TPA: GWxTD domain-containing protein [Ohtaekwangia sp.]|nr:GWxTD domain-containing protein [Ohtaekwangia sp.]
MRLTLTLSCAFLMSLSAGAQALRDINYNYLYNPSEPFTLHLKTMNTGGSFTTFFALQMRDSTVSARDFVIEWQLRNALHEKEGNIIRTDSSSGQAAMEGKIELPSARAQILVARVINKAAKRAWFFYKTLEPTYPVNAMTMADGRPVFKSYLTLGKDVTIVPATPKVVSYYSHDFPAAVPAFSESQRRVSPALKVDSTFNLSGTGGLYLSKKGLYLLQNDTAAQAGFAFRVEDDYPRYAKIESLADPLIYICTKEEFNRMKAAKGDKKAFDRVVLSVTGDKERAKDLMKSYFRRVELANRYFTSYKEGWKTDRGMIYIIFGLPDEVYRFSDREVWNYKNNAYKISFDFVRSATLFDPENHVLVREKKFQETWYEVIDLWRNARF